MSACSFKSYLKIKLSFTVCESILFNVLKRSHFCLESNILAVTSFVDEIVSEHLIFKLCSESENSNSLDKFKLPNVQSTHIKVYCIAYSIFHDFNSYIIVYHIIMQLIIQNIHHGCK